MVFSIPIDFCIEFWNSIFSPVLEYTDGIFLTALARAFQWCKPASVIKLFKFFLRPTQLGHTIVYYTQLATYFLIEGRVLELSQQKQLK